MNANLRNFALWVIIVLLLLALFTLFQNPGQRAASQDISFSQLLTEVDANWLTDPPLGEFPCQAQIRYNSAAADAIARWDGERIYVNFVEPRHGVAPGQAVVLYDGDRTLGGGWIE